MDIGTGSFTIILIMKYTSATQGFIGKSTGGNDGYYPYYDAGGLYCQGRGSTNSCNLLADFGSSHSSGNYEIFQFKINRDKDSSYIYVNNSLLAKHIHNDNLCDITSSNTFKIGCNRGSGYGMNGDIGEIIITRSILSDIENTNLDSYLYVRYGLHGKKNK